MADLADITGEKLLVTEKASVDEIREAAARIPKGVAGECYHCGEQSLRLVRSACAPCRDRLGLP